MIQKIIFLLSFLLSCAVQAQSPKFEYTAEGVWVKENGERVFFYQKAPKSQNGEYQRANYIHPLLGLDGTVLTEDFPEDHPHHRGIFWTWHQVLIGSKAIGDAWACKDFVWEVYEVGGKQENNTLNAKTYWKSPQWTDDDGKMAPFLTEDLKVTIHPKAEEYRVLDFEIALRALVPDLKIGGSDDEKGYGGFSVRMKLPEDIQFTSTNGLVTAQTEAIETGPWLNMSGSILKNDRSGGIVIIAHPDNPLPQNQWILRTSNSMQNPVFPGREPVVISDKEPTVLRYRLVIYQDEISKEEISSLYKDMK